MNTTDATPCGLVYPGLPPCALPAGHAGDHDWVGAAGYDPALGARVDAQFRRSLNALGGPGWPIGAGWCRYCDSPIPGIHDADCPCD